MEIRAVRNPVAGDFFIHVRLDDTDKLFVIDDKTIYPCTCGSQRFPDDCPCPFCNVTGVHVCTEFNTLYVRHRLGLIKNYYRMFSSPCAYAKWRSDWVLRNI